MEVGELQPGRRVRVTQEIERREGNWRTEVVGVIESIQPESCGTWFAHGRDGKVWLTRIRLRKDDGELTVLVVDPLTSIAPA